MVSESGGLFRFLFFCLLISFHQNFFLSLFFLLFFFLSFFFFPARGEKGWKKRKEGEKREGGENWKGKGRKEAKSPEGGFLSVSMEINSLLTAKKTFFPSPLKLAEKILFLK